MTQTYSAALYMRLSVDDELKGESNSIKTQRQMLTKYAQENNIAIYDEYADDGFSGTNFDRPAFQRMIADIDSGKVNCVIVKDLSRLGRNFVLVGQYTDLYFPAKRVRFIAITDNVDSAQGENEIAPFKNIINEWYARDVSKKVSSALQTQFASGKRYSPYPILGYKKDPDDYSHLVIDEDTRWIVELIFSYALQGYGCSKIGRILIDSKVPCPGWIQYERDGTFANVYAGHEEKKYKWYISSVKAILKNETYIGNTVHNKQTSVSFKSKSRYRTQPEMWLRVENTHEPIISKKDFELVQEMIATRRRATKQQKFYPIFTGLIKCADCGWSMSYRENYTKKGPYGLYYCSQYGQNTGYCTMHYIRYDVLYQAVLDDLRKWIAAAEQDEEALLAYLTDSESENFKQSHKRLVTDIARAKKRLTELDNLIAKLYEDRLQDKITERNFDMLISKYQQEQEEQQAALDKKQRELQEQKQDTDNSREWIEMLKQFTDPQELTIPMLNALIEKIYIHEATTAEDKTRSQEIEIHYKFVGQIK